MLPFYGVAHVAYLPDGKVIGLSKMARIVDMYARRLQIQEKLNRQIAQAVMDMTGQKARRWWWMPRICAWWCAGWWNKIRYSQYVTTGRIQNNTEARQALLMAIPSA